LEYEYPFAVEVINNSSVQSGEGAMITPIECDCGRNVILSALYSENGNVYARLYEYGGRNAEAVLKGQSISSHEECNITGKTAGSGNSDGHMNLTKYQIKTYKLNYNK